MTMNAMFPEWLTTEVQARGWSFRELSRRSGLSSSAISQVITGSSFPGFKFCHGVARALELPPETVLRQAGHLPPEPPASEVTSELVYVFNQLGHEEQVRLLVQARALRDWSERERYTAREPTR